MKRMIVGVVAGLALGAAATAGATSASGMWTHKYKGVWCKTSAATHNAVLCVLETGDGFGVAISKRFVMVYNLDSGKQVFVKAQPTL